jgi:hypothetical protein
MLTGEGTYDPAKKEITFTGTMDDFITGERNKPVKYVMRIVDNDSHILEIHDLALGEKSKVGEMMYTRKK